jgi:hypothetical protein
MTYRASMNPSHNNKAANKTQFEPSRMGKLRMKFLWYSLFLVTQNTKFIACSSKKKKSNSLRCYLIINKSFKLKRKQFPYFFIVRRYIILYKLASSNLNKLLTKQPNINLTLRINNGFSDIWLLKRLQKTNQNYQ